MTDKQKKFCEEYLIDHNGTQAAIRAGYSAKTANRIANEILSKPDIKKYIAQRQQEMREHTNITLDYIIEQLLPIGCANIDASRIKASDKIEALKTICRLLGLDVGPNNSGRIEELIRALICE